MCGICGVMVDHGKDADIGTLLAKMAESQQIRAQDSTGFALYSKVPHPKTLLNIIRTQGSNGTNTNNGTKFILEQIAAEDSERDSLLSRFSQNPNIYLASVGRYMHIIKAIGLARDVAEAYNVPGWIGTHGLGHIRIATTASVTPHNAHPFGTLSYPELSVVHNGEITNYGNLRRRLELRGHKFQSDCDSELIAVFIADQLLRHGDFEKAINIFLYGERRGMPAGDGPFTFIAATQDTIGVARDKFGLRKAMVGMAPETVEHPSFIAIATDVSALNQVGAIYDRHSPRAGKPEIYLKEHSLGLVNQKPVPAGAYLITNTPHEEKLDSAKESTFTLDIDQIRNELAAFKGRSAEEQERDFKRYAEEKYRVKIPDGVVKASREKFGGKQGDISNAPILLTYLVNALLRKYVIASSQPVIIQNPHAMYSLLTGLKGKLDVDVFGDVGDSFGAFSKIDGVVRVYGSAENYAGLHAHKGRYVIFDLATELIGEANYGADFLLLNGGTERLNAMGRYGSMVTFGMGHDGGIYMAGGLLLDLETATHPEKVGPGIVGGKIIAVNNASLGKGARGLKLGPEDYEDIKRVLGIHRPELEVHGLESFSLNSPKLYIARQMLVEPSDGRSAKLYREQPVEYDFSHFMRIVSTAQSVRPKRSADPKVTKNVIGVEDIERLLAI